MGRLDEPVAICPQCSGSVPEDSVWIVRDAFYCSELCARASQGLK